METVDIDSTPEVGHSNGYAEGEEMQPSDSMESVPLDPNDAVDVIPPEDAPQDSPLSPKSENERANQRLSALYDELDDDDDDDDILPVEKVSNINNG